METSLRKLLILLSSLLSLCTYATETAEFGTYTQVVEIIERVSDINVARNVNEDLIEENTKNLSELLKISKDFQKISADYSLKVINKLEDKRVLNGFELSTLDQFIKALLINTDKNLELGKLYFTTQDEPLVSDDIERTKENLIWLTAYLNIFENYVTAYDHFFKQGKIRRILKDIYVTREEDVPQLKRLKEVVRVINNKKYREFLRKKVIEFKQNRIALLKLKDPQLTRLIVKVEYSPIANNILTYQYPSLKLANAQDIIVRLFNKFTNFVSGLFGNMAGAVRWRHGHMYEHHWTKQYLLENLRPLDIIAEKTPFALTDLFIPGHFGHIAVWLGTEQQLRDLGMWNHPIILPLQDQIKDGNYILESVRPGSRLTSLEKFLEIDEITIMRVPNILDDYKKYEPIFKGAVDQLDKKYDFNFDVHTLEKVVCSEVIYHAFGKIQWPTAYIFGRSTISPDDVISLAFYDNSPVNLELSIIANKDKKVRAISLEEMGENLGFYKNKTRSKLLRRASFDKKKKECRTKRVRSLRNGTPRWKYVRSCQTNMVFQVYDSGQ